MRQLLAQPVRHQFDAMRIRLALRGEEPLDQRSARYRASGTFDQHGEHQVFQRRERQARIVEFEQARVLVEGKRAAMELRGRIRHASTQHGTDARHCFIDGEWLVEKIVGARVQAIHHIVETGMVREHQHRYRVARIAQFAQQLAARLSGQVAIEQHDIEGRIGQHALRGNAVARPFDGETIVRKFPQDLARQRRIMVGKQDTHDSNAKRAYGGLLGYSTVSHGVSSTILHCAVTHRYRDAPARTKHCCRKQRPCMRVRCCGYGRRPALDAGAHEASYAMKVSIRFHRRM